MENNQDKGFTLVELLIVIVILGILATVTVFAVRGITDKGQENACSVELRTLDTAVEAFYAQNQTDPTVVTTGLDASGTAITNSDGDPTPGLVPEYLKDAPAPADWVFYAEGGVIVKGPGPDGIIDGTNADDDRAGVAVTTQAGFYSANDGKCTGV
jgi:prepilin-type N-terminal cleavage/methylation domain-containing protein